MTITISPIASMEGVLRGPSDKSMTHRAYMLAAIASGDSLVREPLRSGDCQSTLECMTQLGLVHEWISQTEIRLSPPKQWKQPTRDLDCGNSGTTMRLLCGLLASRPLDCTLVGDKSLSRRPMRRIATPLIRMGATIEGDTPPLRIKGGQLQGIQYETPVASAQIKSCCLLAGLGAEGETSVTEPSPSRDHTERMLTAMGAKVVRSTEPNKNPTWTNTVTVSPTESLNPFSLTVPADISSAAFFIVAAATVSGARIIFKDLSVNPTRTGIFDVLDQCRVPYEIGTIREELGEPVADVVVGFARDLEPFTIAGELVPRLIDEIPVLAVLATQCLGTSVIRNASELRVKESDRIELIADGLRRMGANVDTFDDGFEINGPSALHGAFIDAAHDHRIAMAFAIAGLIAGGETVISGADTIDTSYPDFLRDLMRLSIA